MGVDCVDCPAGRSNSSGNIKCSFCGPARYSNEGDAGCSTCASGYECNELGLFGTSATGCRQCIAGGTAAAGTSFAKPRRKSSVYSARRRFGCT